MGTVVEEMEGGKEGRMNVAVMERHEARFMDMRPGCLVIKF